MEHLDHDETLQSPGNPLQQEGSPVGMVCVPLDQGSFCRDSRVVPVQCLSHLKQRYVQVSVHLRFPTISLNPAGTVEWRQAQMEVSTGSSSHKPAFRWPANQWLLFFVLGSRELQQVCMTHRCKSEGNNRQSTNCFPDSQSLELQRDRQIHQVEDIQHKCKVSTPLWTQATPHKSQAFINSCLREILCIQWPEKMRNEDLRKMANQ